MIDASSEIDDWRDSDSLPLTRSPLMQFDWPNATSHHTNTYYDTQNSHLKRSFYVFSYINMKLIKKKENENNILGRAENEIEEMSTAIF